MVSFEKKYKIESESLNQISEFPGKRSVKWQSPSNIALIKYWGKRDFQLPQNPSLSFTLKKSYTETEVEFQFKNEKGISSDFFFEGKEKPEFKSEGFFRHLLNQSMKQANHRRKRRI